MKKIDFTKIEVQDIEDRTITVDITKNLGNQLYMQGQNVEECELGKAIYFAKGELELTDEQARIILNATRGYPYVSRHVIERLLG